MSQKTFNWIAGIIFTVVAIAHLIRSISGWDVVINAWSIPVGVSVLGFLFLSFLAYNAFKLGK